MSATSPASRPAPPAEEPRFAWPGTLCGYLGLGRQPARRPPCIRTDTRSELACDAFRRGGCCTLLLYEALEPCDQIFELWSLSWCGAMGIRTPDLLHAIQRQHVHPRLSVQVTVSGRPHESSGIQAGCCTFVLYGSGPPAVPAERARLPGGARWAWHQIVSVSRPKIAAANGPDSSAAGRAAPGLQGLADGARHHPRENLDCRSRAGDCCSQSMAARRPCCNRHGASNP